MAFKDALEKLLDLPYNYAYKEVEGKLLNTWLKINGELVLLAAIADTYLTINVNGAGKAILKSKVVSLEAWLPETGVYQNSRGLVCFIYKKPIRQWKKSFSTDYYTVLYQTNSFPLSDIVDRKKEIIWVNPVGIIHWFALPIGYIQDAHRVVCTNKLFEQEILDWRNND